MQQEINHEIDVLFVFLKKHFASKRSKIQNKVIHFLKTNDWKREQKVLLSLTILFSLGSIFFLHLALNLNTLNLNVSAVQFNNIKITLGILSLISFLAVFICLNLWQIVLFFDIFRTYEDKLDLLKNRMKEFIIKSSISQMSPKDNFGTIDYEELSLNLLISDFERNLEIVEKDLKTYDDLSYIEAVVIFVLLIGILVFYSPTQSFFSNELRSNLKNNYILLFSFSSLLIALAAFVVNFIRVALKVLANSAAKSKTTKYSECIFLLKSRVKIIKSTRSNVEYRQQRGINYSFKDDTQQVVRLSNSNNKDADQIALQESLKMKLSQAQKVVIETRGSWGHKSIDEIDAELNLQRQKDWDES